MIKKVLIVDDDQEMLLALKEGLEKFDDTFSVLMAGDGMIAVEKLKHHTISLVVTDLKMPLMDGFSLLTHIMENYPGVPVIIITGYSTPEMERLAKKGGAVGYIEKPFMINQLAKRIIETLRTESDGGTLHNVSSGMFLQLMEMEQKTCTIRIYDKISKKQGILFFKEGELLDARMDSLHGEEAAYEIFSWEEVNISIQNVCPQKEKKIQKDLQAILLEAMRQKDERGRQEPSQTSTTASAKVKPGQSEISPRAHKPENAEKIDRLKQKVIDAVGDRCGMQDIYNDDSWDDLVVQMEKVGNFFNGGKLKLAFVDRGDEKDFFLIPGDRTTIISVSTRCPRDRLIQVLMN